MSNTRQVNEGVLRQGADERIAYSIDTTPWGGYTSGAAAALLDITDDDEYVVVTSTNLSGSASAAGNVITTPLVVGLVPGNKYRLEVQWVSSGNTFEAYVVIHGER